MSTTKPEALRALAEHPDSERIITSGDVINGLNDRIAELEARVQELGQMARDVNSRRVVELEAQLASISPPEGMAGWTKASAEGVEHG